MAATYTVDASVLLNAFNPHESGHIESQRFLAFLQAQAVPMIAPTLLLPEVAATIGRGQGDADVAREFVAALTRLPHLVLVPLDLALARVATDVAARNRLRGSDAVYAAVALRFANTLVTLDREQHDRVSGVVPTRYPVEACRELGI